MTTYTIDEQNHITAFGRSGRRNDDAFRQFHYPAGTCTELGLLRTSYGLGAVAPRWPTFVRAAAAPPKLP